jgi:hypothetical protein
MMRFADFFEGLLRPFGRLRASRSAPRNDGEYFVIASEAKQSL